MEPICENCGHFASSHDADSTKCKLCSCRGYKLKEVEPEAVTHPSHYNQGQYEVIDVLADWELDFCDGNTVKYIARAGKKDPAKELEDLEKARFYLDYKIGKILGGERWHPDHRDDDEKSKFPEVGAEVTSAAEERTLQKAWIEFLHEYRQIRGVRNSWEDDLYEAFCAGRKSNVPDKN